MFLACAGLLFYRLRDIPPGLHADVAVTGLDAQDILRGHLQIFFPRNNGREALFIYYLAGLLALAGTDRLVYSFAAIAFGMLSVALSYRLFKLMFGQRLAVLAAALLAVSFWELYVSRAGVRVTLLAPGTVAPVYFLWRTLRWGRWRDSLLTGISLGLAEYTYQPARMLPLLIVVLCLADWGRARRRLRLLVSSALIALAVFLPEGIYFALHPTAALQRVSQVSIIGRSGSATLSRLIRSIGSTAGMFFIHGDPHPWGNASLRPVFDPIVAALFCGGLLIALDGCRRDPRYRWVLLWLVVMSLPSAFATGAPDQFRAYGSAPAAFAFPALALMWLGARLHLRSAGPLLLVLLVGAEGYLTFNAYFQRWGPSRQAATAFDAQDSGLAKFAADHPRATIYFSDIRTLAGQPVRALVPRTQGQAWYPEDSAAIPLPRAGNEDVLYAGSPRSTIASLAPNWLPGAELLSRTTPDNPRGYWAFRWPGQQRLRFLTSQRAFHASFGSDMAMIGYSLRRQATTVDLDILWMQLRPSGPYDLYTHVLDATGKQVAQGDKLYFPAERLGLAEHFDGGKATHDLVLTRYTYLLGPGHYAVEIGVAHRSPIHLGTLLGPAGSSARFGIAV
ncbi:MAG: glycosyltransferase family 39 protein [Chloroflexota bacterium]